MDSELELVSDGEGLAILGARGDVERFLLSSGLGVSTSRELDKRRLHSLLGTGGSAVQAGATVAANSGRWVKLTAKSAADVRKYGLMATKTPGISHGMIGNPGDIKQWIQIVQTPTALLGRVS